MSGLRVREAAAAAVEFEISATQHAITKAQVAGIEQRLTRPTRRAACRRPAAVGAWCRDAHRLRDPRLWRPPSPVRGVSGVHLGFLVPREHSSGSSTVLGTGLPSQRVATSGVREFDLTTSSSRSCACFAAAHPAAGAERERRRFSEASARLIAMVRACSRVMGCRRGRATGMAGPLG